MKTGFIQGFKFRGISTTGVVSDPLYGIVAPKTVLTIVQSSTVCFMKKDSTVAGLA